MQSNDTIPARRHAILLVDDDEDEFVLVRDLLAATKDMEVSWAPDMATALTKIGSGSYDACLLDYQLGEGVARTGLEVLRAARQIAPDLPFIFFTGQGDQLIDQEAMSGGAFEYLEKGAVNTLLLERTLRYAINNATMMKSLRAVVDQLEHTIAQHEAAEAAKRRSIALVELITDALPLPIVYIDANEIIRFANTAYEKHRAIKRANLIGRSLRDVLTSEVYELRQPHLKRVLAGEMVRFEEVVELPAAGKRAEKRIYEQTYVPHVEGDGGGPVLGFLAVVYDLTEKERHMMELKAARDQAERASRTKSSFLAIMSHELRTPLNAIIGFADMMQLGLHGQINIPTYQGYVSDIYNSGQHLLSVVNDLLDISRDDLDRLDLVDFRVDLESVLAWTIRIVSQRATERGVHLTMESSGSVPLLRADERRVRQMALNLVLNAVKFTPRGGAVLVSTLHGLDAERGLGFSVKDNGIGISKIDLPKVLLPFGRIKDPTRKNEGEGCGLGLPLTKRLAEMHGGKLEIESDVGRGTEVRVWFPSERVIEPPREACKLTGR